jgi:CRP/FNR family transcriptional regulator, cyclic AMP receptor protein
VKIAKNHKIDLLKRVPLFASSSKKELAEITTIADEIDLPQGKVLIREGDQGHEFFVLVDGTVDVIRGGRKLTSMGPGDFFGEIALVAKRPRSATIKATSPVRALVINERAFRALLERSPKVQLGVLKALAERVAQTM